MNDQVDSLKQHSVFSVGMLNFLGFGRFLCFVENGLQAFRQPCAHAWVL